MPAKNDFDADPRLPCFLTDNPEQQSVDDVSQTAVISSQVLRASIGAIAATAIVIAILALGNPFTLLAEVSPSLVHKSAPLPATDKFTEQSIAAAQASQPSEQDRPTQDESLEAAHTPTGNSEVESESLLRHFQVWAADRGAQVGPVEHTQDVPERDTVNSHFRQFEAWAAEKDAQVQVESLQSAQGDKTLVVKEAPAHVAAEAQTSPRPTEPRRHVRPVENARAELRPAHNARTNVRPEQNAKAQNPSAEARAPR